MSQLFASGGQSIGASGSASVLSINIMVGTRISFRVDWFDLLAVQGTLTSLLQLDQKDQFFGAKPSSWSSSHIHT